MQIIANYDKNNKVDFSKIDKILNDNPNEKELLNAKSTLKKIKKSGISKLF